MQIKSLPLGTSEFSALRQFGQIYVDKTDLIYELAVKRGKFFLARPRRFGKSLLLSTFESLFSAGLRDFSGLKIEKLWTEEQKYKVIKLNFSLVRDFRNLQEFSEELSKYFFNLMITENLEVPIVIPNDGLSNFINWMAIQKNNSVVLLIDEYDAPLTACLDNPKLFADVRLKLAKLYAAIKDRDGIFRFLFVTGITKFNKVSIFSELNSLSDLTLNPNYGTILGYTPEETETYFSEYLKEAEKKLKLDKRSLMESLIRNYDGFCFDKFAEHRVFAPWSVLKFLNEPELGFQNYWFESGGKPSVLLQYMNSHILRDPEEYCSNKSIPLDELSGSSDIEGLSDLGLLTQAGYLTIKGVKEGVAFLDYPNEEVRKSMALLYVRQILGERLPAQVGAGKIKEELFSGNAEAVFQQLNHFFASIDYQNYPVENESILRAIVFSYIAGTGLEVKNEVHNFKGRSDLEVKAGDLHWILELKVVRPKENSDKKLEEAVDQITNREYGAQSLSEKLKRMALVFSVEKRKFVRWSEI